MVIQDFASMLNGVMWTQVVFAIIFIALRMYTRYFVIRCIGWDDIIMLINLLTFVGYVACISTGVSYGIGKKFADVDPADYSKAIMWEVIGQAVCIMGIAASKASVALFLLRIVLERWHIAVLWFCIISTTALCLITTTLLFLQCAPVEYLWDRSIARGVCWLNFTQVGLTMGGWSAAMDFVLALLPWHVVIGLNMKRKEKLTVACGLSLGVFAGICSSVRTYELHTLSSLDEYVYDTVPMLLWSSTEVLVTIVCACIPVLRPLYVRIVYGSRGDSSGERSYPLNEYSRKGSGGFDISAEKESGAGSRIYIGAGESVLQKSVRMRDSNLSEESILRESNSNRLQLQLPDFDERIEGIRRTSEIQIINHSRGSPV